LQSSVHLDDLAAIDGHDPYVDDVERDEAFTEEMAEQEAIASDPRGELAKYVRAVPQSKWPRDSNGKYFLEWKDGM
jgi:hypothetical protein